MTENRSTAMLEIPSHAEAGLRCSECASRLCAEVEGIPGVLHVACDPGAATIRVEYDSDRLSESDLDAASKRRGVELAGVYEHAVWRVSGLD